MKKIFLIPLMTLVCSVMAWGSEITVSNFADLKTQLSASGTAEVVKLANDIAYPTNGSDILNIGRSLTLDGQGHMIKGYGKTNIHASGSGQDHFSVIAVNANVFGVASTLNVTIKNLTLGNVKDEYTTDGQQKSATTSRFYGIISFDGVAKLTLENDSVKTGVSSYDTKKKMWTGPSSQQPLCVTGTNATPVDLTIKDSYVCANTGGYPAYILKPVTATLTNSTFEGFCALYFKYQASVTYYGNTVGTRGSVVNAKNCAFNAPNIHSGKDNDFAVFPMEDDGIDMTIENCSFNADHFGDQPQAVISLQYNTRTSGFQPIKVKFKGDNTHVYNVAATNFAWNSMATGYEAQITQDGGRKGVNVGLQVTIEGGTYDIDPRLIKYSTYGASDWVYPIKDINHETHPYTGEWTYASVDEETYEVKTVNQGSKTLYRVVPRTTTLYDLNDNVQSQGGGQNPNTSFELSTGEDMTLNQATTKAGYVEVKDHATAGATTVTVAKNDVHPEQSQTLVINNGLDVQGESQVIVEPTAALVIGEGGIVTESSANIVIEADEDGAASLLLDPTITVNQTPELTVKMTVPKEHAGYEMLGSDKYRHWHRFAMPVDHMAATWVKEPDIPTYLYGWDYSAQKWAQVGVTEMVPFAGYTLSPDKAISTNTAVTYTFKGKLLGNTDCKLELNHHGYNFFGNSYTGYISILKLVEQIMGDAKIDGTVWMWDGEKYQGVALANLAERPGLYKSWQKEVAPMQTFVLRLTGSEFSSTDINYADAIWGNPRYDAAKTALNAAPARQAEINDDAIIRMTIEANGQKESVVLIENGVYSDAYDRGYDAIKYMNENCFNTYVGVNGENYGTVATDNLDGKMLSIKTNNELAYSMTFDFVAGEEYALRDNLTGNVIAIEEGATYEFAAQPNSTIEGRFEIVSVAKMPTAIENTEVKANVKGIYTLTGQYVGEDFEALPAGVYVVNGVKIVK